MTLPTDAAARKALPLASGVLDYFPAALAEVARCSQAGNDQHNPGQPLHWARAKSSDEADALVRHLMERGTVDSDGIRHSAKVAWRALALLQKELEAAGAPVARGAREAVVARREPPPRKGFDGKPGSGHYFDRADGTRRYADGALGFWDGDKWEITG